MAAMAGIHLRSYTRLEQGAVCRFPTIESILIQTGASPHTRASVCLAWFEAQIGQKNFQAVMSQFRSLTTKADYKV